MDYTRLEVLTDCICRKCSMRATLHRLEQDAERLTTEAGKSSHVSQSKKKRAREARRLALRLRTALEEGRIEEDIKGVKIEKVFSRASTKQAMVARVRDFLLYFSSKPCLMRSMLNAQPPPVLALHLNRSVHFGAYASKNSARVHFAEVLDLTPFTTSGMLSTTPSFPISSHMPSPTAAAASLVHLTTKAQNPMTQPPRVLYRLAAVVCHYGQHSFGHYVCFRRKPRGTGRVAPPRLDEPPVAPGRGWLRASDDAVREVGIETVLQEGSGAFMLYYERVRNGEDGPSVWSTRHCGTDVDDDVAREVGGGSEKAQSFRLQDAPKWESSEEEEKEKAVPTIRARVVRSVSLGREDEDEDEDADGVTVKQEAEDTDLSSEARLLSAPTPAKLESIDDKPVVELPTSAVSTEAPPPIPDTPTAVDEPPIMVPTIADLRT